MYLSHVASLCNPHLISLLSCWAGVVSKLGLKGKEITSQESETSILPREFEYNQEWAFINEN